MSGVVIGPLIAGLTADLHGVNGAVYAFTILAIAITLGTLIVRESNEMKYKNKTVGTACPIYILLFS